MIRASKMSSSALAGAGDESELSMATAAKLDIHRAGVKVHRSSRAWITPTAALSQPPLITDLDIAHIEAAIVGEADLEEKVDHIEKKARKADRYHHSGRATSIRREGPLHERR